MSRSNHHYHNVCYERPFLDSYGVKHSCWDAYKGVHCLKSGEYMTRRGPFKRKPRFSGYGRFYYKSILSVPPSSDKKLSTQKARAMQKREFLKDPEDPVITPITMLYHFNHCI